MSVHAVERVLFDLTAAPQAVTQFQSDPDAFLATYRLAQDEVKMLRELDVKRMLDLKVDAMLAMRAFNAVEGREKIPEYMRRINAPPRI